MRFLFPSLAFLIALTVFLGYRTYSLSVALTREEAQYAEERSALEESVVSLEKVLAETMESRDALSRDLQVERARTTEFARTLDGLKNSVSTLEKLQYTDPELLAKYSKVYFLSEHYVPAELAQIPSTYATDGRSLEIHARVLPHLTDMLKKAEEAGVNLRVASAYRSFGTQAALKSSYTVMYGSGANQFSADQGYSEHQLGTTVDFSTKELGANFTSIEDTEAFAWLTENAHRYGFVLSYPKGNSYYQYEPWHWRYVGEKLARHLKQQGKHLYDLDQRTLDEYLVFLFE